MRLLHTADWHLGRTLHGASLLDDQAHLLEQFVDLARREKPDVVVIAGDVYDRAVPPSDVVRLLDDVLCRVVMGLKIPVVVIAGNHDAADRLAFASRLLDGQGLHILGQPVSSTAPVILNDDHGPFYLYPLPYAEPAIVRHCLDNQELQGHQEAMRYLLEGIWSRHPKGQRTIAVAHCFVTGSTECESERPLSVGGAGMIESAVFKGFDYVALGHLHRPQSCDKDRIQYSGSLMRYSFSEADHDKAVLMVEMGADAKCHVERVSLTPRRQVRCLEGTLTEVLDGAKMDKAPEDYVMVTLLDEGPIFDAMGKLRSAYPNCLHIERPVLSGRASQDGPRVDHRKMGDRELFGSFFEQVTGEPLTKKQVAAFATVADEVRRGEREDVA